MLAKAPPQLIRTHKHTSLAAALFPEHQYWQIITQLHYLHRYCTERCRVQLSSAALPIFSETGVCVRPATSNRCLLLLLLLLLLFLLLLLLLLVLLHLLVPLQICPAVVSALLDIFSISNILQYSYMCRKYIKVHVYNHFARPSEKYCMTQSKILCMTNRG